MEMKWLRLVPSLLVALVLRMTTVTSFAYSSSTRDIWWNLGLHGPELWKFNAQLYVLGAAGDLTDGPQPSPYCSRLRGLSPGQTRFCALHEDHMPSVGRGVRLGVAECQRQFSVRRWNCSTSTFGGLAGSSNATSLFGPVTDIGSRETAFTYAILAAGVVHSLSRSCRDGELNACGCSQRPRPAGLHRDWVWGGCGDNVEYGYKAAHGFVDIREREKNYPRRSRQLARMLMNLHNNEAGRRAVYKYARPACKCHGVSGSCNIKTCWNQLAPFTETGNRLKERYDIASEVKFNQQGTALVPADRRFNRPSREDLIFFESSPDYCQADPQTGSFGTVGRRCDRSSPGIEGCGLMCCGRGYNIQRTRVTERCQCKFQWCCFVKCKTCERVVNVYTCK